MSIIRLTFETFTRKCCLKLSATFISCQWILDLRLLIFIIVFLHKIIHLFNHRSRISTRLTSSFITIVNLKVADYDLRNDGIVPPHILFLVFEISGQKRWNLFLSHSPFITYWTCFICIKAFIYRFMLFFKCL